MCRHLAYLGPAQSLASVLTHGEYSLMRQSWAPRDMRGGGTINADGVGLAWWRAGRARAYRSAQPAWSCPDVDGVLAEVHAEAAVAAVRSATVGMPVNAAACAPFTDGLWAFSHNGVVDDWTDSLSVPAKSVDPVTLMTMPAPTDSAMLWAVLSERLTRQEPASALSALVGEVADLAPRSRLNLLLCDGERVYATAWGHALSVRHNDRCTWVSSEPLDDEDGWIPVPDRHLVEASCDEFTITPIEGAI